MGANLFGNRFYSLRVPAWHSLGLVTKTEMNAVEALTALGGGYWFEKRPVFVVLNNKQQETDDFAIVRSATSDDPKERLFGYVTDRYNIVQPLEICELFDENVKCPVQTLGMLGNGEKIFLTWKLPDYSVNKDVMNTYGFVACGYDGKFGAALYLVTTRVVCQNTFSIAIAESQKGLGKVWSGKHISINIKRDLGIWMEHVTEKAMDSCSIQKNNFERMSAIPLNTEDDVYSLLFNIYPNAKPLPEDYPEKLASEKQEAIDANNNRAENDRNLVYQLFSKEGTAIDATAWGLFNAVTEYENWGRMTKKSAEYSIVMGNRQKQMNKAYNIIMEYMKK
jgi:hypothetical protein